MIRTFPLLLLFVSLAAFAIEKPPEAEVVAVIEAGGFTLKCYNRIVELTGTYQSIRAKCV